MFDELNELAITELYTSYKAIILPSVNNQLSTSGLILDLDSLPVHPVPFKELFIRWLISINKKRIAQGEQVFVSRESVLSCPLWRLIKCPLKSLKLTKEGMFNKPKVSTIPIGSKRSNPTKGTIGTRGPSKTINR